jgi:hypothetical protein
MLGGINGYKIFMDIDQMAPLMVEFEATGVEAYNHHTDPQKRIGCFK